MTKCFLCPRNCGSDRENGERGFCGLGALPVVARAAAHFGEEPCITGCGGSGTVFFSGCNMHCVFCQNREISFEGHGKEISVTRLAEIFSELEDSGVHNLNLVTATHFADKVVEALKLAKPKIPVVWNSTGYESVETLKMLEGFVQVYMPDLKYSSSDAALRYSGARNYPFVAKQAILEMYRQTGPFVMDDEGLLKSGVLIRHLILPDRLDDTFDVIDWVTECFPKNAVLFSLMSQFVPLADKEKYPELDRLLTKEEYERAQSYLSLSGIKNGYFQELSSATDELIPDFDLTGV
ncbi:MAG: radical SAM protein [Firmicutes bacterium HGW-Firmicutes-16]|nr:MAG: radical SAM protein [Firmicutes bacterium HGW-Firmicutes-16]